VHDEIGAGRTSEPATATQRIEHAQARHSWGTQEPPASSIERSVLNPEHVGPVLIALAGLPFVVR
jgi:hypothetical protein